MDREGTPIPGSSGSTLRRRFPRRNSSTENRDRSRSSSRRSSFSEQPWDTEYETAEESEYETADESAYDDPSRRIHVTPDELLALRIPQETIDERRQVLTDRRARFSDAIEASDQFNVVQETQRLGITPTEMFQSAEGTPQEDIDARRRHLWGRSTKVDALEASFGPPMVRREVALQTLFDAAQNERRHLQLATRRPQDEELRVQPYVKAKATVEPREIHRLIAQFAYSPAVRAAAQRVGQRWMTIGTLGNAAAVVREPPLVVFRYLIQRVRCLRDAITEFTGLYPDIVRSMMTVQFDIVGPALFKQFMMLVGIPTRSLEEMAFIIQHLFNVFRQNENFAILLRDTFIPTYYSLLSGLHMIQDFFRTRTITRFWSHLLNAFLHLDRAVEYLEQQMGPIMNEGPVLQRMVISALMFFMTILAGFIFDFI